MKLDAKQFGLVQLMQKFETQRKTGSTGPINAKVRATKSRRDFSQ